MKRRVNVNHVGSTLEENGKTNEVKKQAEIFLRSMDVPQKSKEVVCKTYHLPTICTAEA